MSDPLAPRIITGRSITPMPARRGRKAKRYEAGRRCPSCNAKLATDNPGPLCSPCSSRSSGSEATLDA